MAREGRVRPLRLHRLALVRLGQRWPMSVALGLALALAVGLSTAVTLVEAISAEASLQDTVRQLGPTRYLEVDPRNLVTVEELVIVDAAGRLQLPAEYVEAVGLRGTARVRMEDGRIVLTPVPVDGDEGAAGG